MGRQEKTHSYQAADFLHFDETQTALNFRLQDSKSMFATGQKIPSRQVPWFAFVCDLTAQRHQSTVTDKNKLE